MRHTVLDFSRRMGEVFKELAEVESRSQLEILRDLLTTSSDLIRVRAAGQKRIRAAFRLRQASHTWKVSEKPVLAAACSTIRKSAQYPTKKPVEAVDYVKKVRLGQTEQGSFVLTVLCPIPPELSPAATFVPIEPYGRRVTKTFMGALSAIQSASRHAVEEGRLGPFREAIQQGVSANLCDALVRIGEAIPETAIDITMAWSKNACRNWRPDRASCF